MTWTLTVTDGTTQALLGTGYWQTYFGSGSGTPTEHVDEVKFGTALADVASVPEPATWALLALSLTTVTVLRRRRW